MTAPARMTPEREAELRALITGPPPVHNRPIIRELLDALAAERAHAQQVEVMHSSAAVLGYSVATPTSRDVHPWRLTDRYLSIVELDPALPRSDRVDFQDGECIVAVVLVGPDGRITP